MSSKLDHSEVKTLTDEQLTTWKKEFGEGKVWTFELTDEAEEQPYVVVIHRPSFAKLKSFQSDLAQGGAKMTNAIIGLLRDTMLYPTFNEFYLRVDDASGGPGDRPGWLMVLSGAITKGLGYSAEAIRKK